MNSKTAKLINLFCRITGKKNLDMKRWWKSLLAKDRCKSRQAMGVIVAAHQEKERKQRAEAEAA